MPCATNQSTSPSKSKIAMDINKDESILISGVLETVNKKNPKMSHKLFVVVHQTTTEHFAVLYPLRLLACARKAIATINLKSSSVSKAENNLLVIRPRKDFDGVSLMLRVVDAISTDEQEELTKDWIRCLSPQKDQNGSFVEQIGFSDFIGSPSHDRKRRSRVSLPVLMEIKEDVED